VNARKRSGPETSKCSLQDWIGLAIIRLPAFLDVFAVAVIDFTNRPRRYGALLTSGVEHSCLERLERTDQEEILDGNAGPNRGHRHQDEPLFTYPAE
jgi:hypothetical protein